jgi:CRISPR-associated endonuclease Csn1
MAIILGLDLGPSSIGWALLEDSQEESKIIDLGVRIFQEGVDAFDTSKEVAPNESRRIARGMRRQIRRRAFRKKQLAAALIEAGLWPRDKAAQASLLDEDPFKLRKEAFERELSPHEFGRVLLHLNQRRGFLSNRKKDRGDSEVQGMLAEINELAEEMGKANSPSLGAYFRSLQEKNPLERIRGHHTRRSMFESEFEALWTVQQKHHPKLLTEKLKFGIFGKSNYPQKPIPRDDARRKNLSTLEAFGIHGLIFYQRPMYWPKSSVGLCELEPKQKRCSRADRHAQRFRMLQEVNNLKYTDPDVREEFPLDAQQRAVLLDYLSTRDKATFDQIKRKLGFLESVKFNLERGERSSIKGMIVDVLIAKAVGKAWHARSEEEKDLIVRILLDNEREDDLVIARLVDEFGFTTEEADNALDVDFPAGYLGLSLKAIDKLLPHMERGLVYQAASDPEKSALHAAGYLRRDELRRRLFDKLPDPSRARAGDLKIGDIPNPVVKRALVELRKVVNAIIKQYGRPDAVHLEMTRSLRMGKEKRSDYNSQIRKREAEREAAAEVVRGMKIKLSRDAVLRYLLWQEQAMECVYCGKAISQNQLFTGEADVDHILPYSRCLDDSQMNKVICHRKCNHGKTNRTPYEWLASSDPDGYDRVCVQVGSLLKKGLMPYRKYRRFMQKELELDSFIARQLTDTGYIVEATGEYLRCLFEKDHHVLGLKGQLTSELRWQWGLETVIEELPDSPAWQEQNKLRDGEKNRADHRHHAIDAVVLALTNRSRLQQLSKLVKAGGARKHGEILPEPWENFREDVKARIKDVNVSHRVERKVAGALHEETLYGKTENPTEWVVRKPLENLSANEIEKIRDETIRNLVIARLKEHGIEFGRGKKPDTKKMKTALAGMTMPSGVPIKKVRVLKPEQTIRAIRSGENTAYVKPGSMHHLAIFEWEVKGKKKREAVFVSMLDAIDRLKRKEEVIQRTPPKDHESIPSDAKFIMSLSSREMVLANFKGQEKLLTFKTAASTQGQIYFAEHTDARRSGDQAKFVATANSLDAQKVTVDPLGRIRWAND